MEGGSGVEGGWVLIGVEEQQKEEQEEEEKMDRKMIYVCVSL